MMMEKELLDTYDINNKFLGVKTREFCHGENPKCYHKAVYIWIRNKKGQILVQQKSLNKTHSPGKWDMPVAGHVKAGEPILDACVRETQEELGILIPKKDFVFKQQFLYEKGHQFCEIFVVNKNVDLKTITLQAEEVAQVKWLNFDEFANLLFSTNFANHPTEYRELVFNLLKNKE